MSDPAIMTHGELVGFFDEVTNTNLSLQGAAEMVEALRHADNPHDWLIQGELNPGMKAFKFMSDQYEYDQFDQRPSLTVLKDLDVLQRAVDGLRSERRYCTASRALIDRALTDIHYGGEGNIVGLELLGGTVDRAWLSSSKKIPSPLGTLERAQSKLGVYGKRVAIPLLSGHVVKGTVAAWGPMALYGRPGLGLAVNRDDGQGQILDIGHDFFEFAA